MQIVCLHPTAAVADLGEAAVHGRPCRLTIEVNPELTDLSSVVDWFLQGKSGEILPALARAFAR